jgi:plasmid stabilization system protein ParE
MVYRIEITDTADADVESALQWIARDSPENAARWKEGLIEKIATLEHNPDRCPIAPENERYEPTLRELLYGRRRGVYRILFAVEDDLVRILFVRHAARRNLGEQE